jgi:hypothetical protein
MLTPIKAAFAPEEAKPGRKSRLTFMGPYKIEVQDKGYPKLVDPKGRKIEHAVILLGQVAILRGRPNSSDALQPRFDDGHPDHVFAGDRRDAKTVSDVLARSRSASALRPSTWGVSFLTRVVILQPLFGCPLC